MPSSKDDNEREEDERLSDDDEDERSPLEHPEFKEVVAPLMTWDDPGTGAVEK